MRHPVDVIIDTLWDNKNSATEYTAVRIITALKRDGFVIVPREPTEGMITAGVTESHETPSNYAYSLEMANVFKAMVGAWDKDGAR